MFGPPPQKKIWPFSKNLKKKVWPPPQVPFPPPSPSLLALTMQQWFQTKHKGGHATASYASLSMGISLRETPFAAIQLCLSTTTILLFHSKTYLQ